MSEYKIEKGLPVEGRSAKNYPFAQMEVGDSILDPGVDYTQKSKLALAARAWFRNNGGKSASRMVKGGVRVWRIE